MDFNTKSCLLLKFALLIFLLSFSNARIVLRGGGGGRGGRNGNDKKNVAIKDVTYDGRGIKINGQRLILVAGSIHYPRSTPEMWFDLIQKSRDGGLNTIDTYVFWNIHEPQRRQYDFSGRMDLVRFLKTIQAAGMYAVLRLGPYVCAEWNYGGFPVWLHNLPGIQLRTNNEVFKNEMKTFTTLIVDMLKRENLFASQGGPIILAQIENEYGNVNSQYGKEGQEYLKWCINLAQSFQINEPWFMSQEDDAPSPMINTFNGWYADGRYPQNKTFPKMWTENWSGWFKDWGNRDPHRPAEELAFSVARFFQLGGTYNNYYMYHGGTNFGRTSGGPYITTSYDYDGPLDEYGNLNQPKYGHLKQLHLLLKSLEAILTNGNVQNVDIGNLTQVTQYTANGKSVCFFSNSNFQDKVIAYEGASYLIPAVSVSIFMDCNREVYNTAKVNTQTSIMVKKPNDAEEDPYSLKWQWMPEAIEPMALGTAKPLTSVPLLLEQKAITNDTSDYLWYMTSIDIHEKHPLLNKNVTLRVNNCGHILHAFLNGKLIGSQFAQNGHFQFTFEQKITLKIGSNKLSLLSATVGLQNYGAFFDTVETGVRGPVELVSIGGNNTEVVVTNLSTNIWSYKVGLSGEEQEFYNADNPKLAWQTANLPSNVKFVWYKTKFNAPLGTDPVVVDLMGLGKGEAWINGQSIGRYWPQYLADEEGCGICDYRMYYDSSQCHTNCGKPSQRWYHIPRSFLRDTNTLVLFEEFGGNPFLVRFQTVTVGTVCGNAYEGNALDLSCQGGQTISSVKFVSFGDPVGLCGSFNKGSCESPKARSVVEQACLGQERCSIQVSEDTLGPTGCNLPTRRLAVEAICYIPPN